MRKQEMKKVKKEKKMDKKKVKKKLKKKLNKKLLIPLFAVFVIGLVAALTYYAVFSVDVSVHQPISFNEEELSQSIADCNSGEVCLGESITVSNDGDSARVMKIVQTEGNPDIEVAYVGKLSLTKKDTTTWAIIGDPTEIIYTITGEEFESSGVPEGYVLIYYKDAVVGLEGRLVNPQPVVEVISGNLPQGDDANLNADYSQAPDYYAHKVGAKLWAVPAGAILEGSVLNWSQMNNFLYETDLIYYFANADGEMTVPANSFITFYPVFKPSVYVESGDYTFNFELQ